MEKRQSIGKSAEKALSKERGEVGEMAESDSPDRENPGFCGFSCNATLPGLQFSSRLVSSRRVLTCGPNHVFSCLPKSVS